MTDRIDSRLITRCVMAPWGRTSIKLEPEFWTEVDQIAAVTEGGVGAVVANAMKKLPTAPLTSAVRVFVLQDLRNQLNA